MSLKLWISWELSDLSSPEKMTELAGMHTWDPLFHDALEAVLQEEQVDTDVEAELNVVDDDAIHELNAQYRKVDAATDVLSFPMCYLDPGKAAEQMKIQMKDPETQCVMLGNIVLSWDHVQAQAKEFGHSEKREAVFLLVHSMLHLLGYDHMEPKDEEVMMAKQRKIMEILNIPRE